MWSMVAQRLIQIAPPAATPDQLRQRVEATWSAVPQEHIQSLSESMPRRGSAVISNNGVATLNTLLHSTHSEHSTTTALYYTSQKSIKFNHLILGQHVIYKINFAVLSLVFLCVAFTVASSVYKPACEMIS
ncbi:uncharacterized protein TNCV_1431471 [Trichonephila clavipes]|nr:uncharacterized protein TNCV_1431471 [Trichonephila clavipes]